MTWTFRITTGAILQDGERFGSGYSGLGDGKDNPKLVAVHGVGPIPPGQYDIGPISENHPDLGPHVMALTSRAGTETFGRSAFFIHGDSISHSGAASHGCICTGPLVRQAIGASGDTLLEVIE